MQAIKRRKLNPNSNQIEQIERKVEQNDCDQKQSSCTFLEFDIFWHLMHNEFINYQQFSLILAICTSMGKYTNYLKFINDVPISVILKNPNKKSNPTDVVIQIIKSITPNDILDGNDIISQITGSNINLNDPTACGTYANSLFYTITSKVETKFNHRNKSYILGSLEQKSWRLLEILKLHDNRHTSCIYRLSISSCDLYKKTDSNNNSNNEAQLSECFRFPGHAIGLIRMAPNKYIFTQTYVKMYDHKRFIEVLDLNGVLELCKMFMYICKCDVVDELFIKYWNYITHIDATCIKDFKFPHRSSISKFNVFSMEFVF